MAAKSREPRGDSIKEQGSAPLVVAMMRPDFYPETPATVELRQTHISCVFIAGDYVYKVKKPVRFAFIDCSDINSRYRFCMDETRLNSRLSPEVYCGVFAIVRRGEGWALGPRVEREYPEAVEYAVKMRRLPDSRMLDRLLVMGLVGSDEIVRIAEKIARFHAGASADRGWNYGRAAQIEQMLEREFDENRAFVGNTLDENQLAEMAAFCRGFVRSNSERIDRRASGGRVREGHGDLRAEHICLRGDRIDVIDCVEFSERLRYSDAASEIAFLAMDVERLGAPALADELVVAYARITGDPEMPQFVPFYKCYRASVRGKVESLRSREAEVEDSQRAEASERARGYFALASRYARLGSPSLVAVCGLSGTGKTTVAGILQGRTGFEIFSSDNVRKRLAGVAAKQTMSAAYRAGIYSDGFSKLTYDTMIGEAEATLRAGRGVIVDATFQRSSDRARMVAVARRLNVPLLIVECTAPSGEVMRRLERRIGKADEVSDATPEIYEKQAKEFEPINEIPKANHVRVNTLGERARIADELEAALERAILSSHAVAGN